MPPTKSPFSAVTREARHFVRRSAFFVTALLVAGALSANANADEAPRAAYAGPDELADEGVPHLAELGVFARYQRSTDEVLPVSVAEGALHGRVLLGRRAAYCLGLDGHAGGGTPGASYGATAYLAGIGFRSSNASFVSACGGLGFDALGDALPLGFAFRPELRAALTLGPVRPVVWFRPSLQLSDARRARDGDRPFDDYEAGVWLRIGRQHRYWRTLSAGGGPALGFSYSDQSRIKQLGFWLGLDFAGGE
jgi:hypothetical protein